MGGSAVAAALGALGLLALAGSDLPLETVAAGEQSGVRDARQLVVRAPEDWEQLWQEHAPRQPIPKVDFGERMVVGLFLGTRPTSGFAVRVTRARLAGQDLVIEYAERRPSANAMVMPVITSPFQLVSLPKRAGEIRFEPVFAASPMR